MRTFIIFLMVAVNAVVWANPLTVAVIDLEELVRLHPNTAADKKLLEETLREYSAQKEQLQLRADKTREAFETAVKDVQNPALSEKNRRKLEEEAMGKRDAALDAERELTETVRSLQRQLTEQEVRMLKRTTAEIEKAIAEYAKNRDIDLVLQLPGEKLGGVSGVLYSRQALNITADVMPLLGIEPGAKPADTVDVTGLAE